MTELSAVALALAALPALMVLTSGWLYRAPRRRGVSLGELAPPVSLLIPARDEEANIERVVRSALASTGLVGLEVIVLDDASTDRTAEIVRRIAEEDPRVRLESAPALPAGWCGKMHACDVLGRLATHDELVWVDADCWLEPEGLARLVLERRRRAVHLLSGVPRQVTVTPGEQLLVPLIHYVLLGFLPMPGVRWTGASAFAAGCGQLFSTHRRAWDAAGRHEAIRGTLHDGLALPQRYRERGLKTDLVDATPLISCRMYRSAAEVHAGLLKNAHEGMATPSGLPVWAALLLGSGVLPFVALATASSALAWELALTAVAGVWVTRLVLAARIRQPALAALLHHLGIAWLLGIQVQARWRGWRGLTAGWKGRVYPA